VADYQKLKEIAKVIPKEVMEQYEEIRAAGPCNMFDIRCVQIEADLLGYHALASLTKGKYVLILTEYEDLMEFHGVKRH